MMFGRYDIGSTHKKGTKNTKPSVCERLIMKEPWNLVARKDANCSFVKCTTFLLAISFGYLLLIDIKIMMKIHHAIYFSYFTSA